MSIEIEKYIEYIIYQRYNLCNRLGIDKEDLMQVGQEAYLTLLEEYGQAVTLDRVCNKINYQIKKYIIGIQKHSNILSLDEEANYVGNSVHLETDQGLLLSIDPCLIIENKEFIEEILECMKVLTDQEKHIVYSISWSETPKTVTELSREMDLSKQRVSAVYKKATEKLREAINSKN